MLFMSSPHPGKLHCAGCQTCAMSEVEKHKEVSPAFEEFLGSLDKELTNRGHHRGRLSRGCI